jgi:UDP-N-acetylmuramoyl-tripeptide--D-alanyl-D-alanine ligase
MKRTLGEFARLCGGRLIGSDAPYTDVVSDTRSLTAGELFIALRGPRFNGNDFLASALALRAAGAVVDAAQPVALPQIVVRDTQAALERAARAWRADFKGPLVGVAGSNGKTTAKEMTAAILGEAGDCLATRGNLNNHIGVPLTLLRLEPTHRFAVVEMGANHAGEVEALVGLASPSVGMITNAGAPRGLRQSRGGGPRGRGDGRRSRGQRNRGHQRRRCLRTALAWPDARARRYLRRAHERRLQCE